MNQYHIKQKVKTLAKIDEDFSNYRYPKAEFEFGNIKFKQWECNLRDGSIGDSWIAEYDLEANNVKEAYDSFSEKITGILAKICFIGQCYMGFENESSLVLRKNSNPYNDFIVREMGEQADSPLSFGKQEQDNLKKLETYLYPQTFRFLQESINTPNYYSRLALLFAALEAMSGEVKRKTCSCPLGKETRGYNKNKMKEILNDDSLYNDLFGSDGFRHKLLHGSLVDFVINKDYFSKIYKAIISYFNRTGRLNIEENIVKPARHFDSRSELLICLRPSATIDFKEILAGLAKEKGSYYIGKGLGKYEVIEHLSNY